MQPWYRHVRMLMKSSRITQTDLAETLGLSQGAVSHFLTGRRQPSLQQIEQIAQTLGKEVEDLLEPEELLHFEHYARPPDLVASSVPIISWRRAHERCGKSPVHTEGAVEYVQVPGHLERGAFALRVADDSMVNPNGTPTFTPGSIIVVDPGMDPQPGHFVVACGGTDNIAFRELVRDAETTLLKPLNPRYPISRKSKGTRICGVVVGKAYESML